MGLTIRRKADDRVLKSILHRTADIPGGVGVSVENLGGGALLEGTPLGKGKDGLFVVCKTAKLVTKATDNATTYEVAKGHHFQVGDRFAADTCSGQEITAINKKDTAKDVITVAATLGKALEAGTCAFESAGENAELKVTPVAIAGSNEDVVGDDNLFVSAWVIGVVREENAPAVDTKIKSALKGIVYV